MAGAVNITEEMVLDENPSLSRSQASRLAGRAMETVKRLAPCALSAAFDYPDTATDILMRAIRRQAQPQADQVAQSNTTFGPYSIGATYQTPSRSLLFPKEEADLKALCGKNRAGMAGMVDMTGGQPAMPLPVYRGGWVMDQPEGAPAWN